MHVRRVQFVGVNVYCYHRVRAFFFAFQRHAIVYTRIFATKKKLEVENYYFFFYPHPNLTAPYIPYTGNGN